jgi:hypothetical protein
VFRKPTGLRALGYSNAEGHQRRVAMSLLKACLNLNLDLAIVRRSCVPVAFAPDVHDQRTSGRTMAAKSTLWELCTAIPIQAL